ncbi:MAG: putative O-glycosylation ligase, exosortase A system-associated [Magnetococcales bacterium]|nr:putative O-glycosylation ligase, exosortase A system-associated [Magnetococcales bacterium]MBF0156544.1 putative O-glycosylation ligase, exosortase A system-associated [Magnetococcales bacterium]
MRDLFLTLFVFGMIPVTLVRPQWGLLIWAWISYMNPHRLTWSFAYEFRFNYFIALATLLGILFSKHVRIRIPMNAVTILWFLFVVWVTITTWTSLNPTYAWQSWERFIKIQLMVVSTFILMTEKEWLNRLAWVIVVSVGFWGMKGGIFTITTGGAYRVFGPPSSFIADNNDLALALIMTIPLMGYLYQCHANRWIRMMILSMMLTSIVSVAGSYSRGGFLGLGVLGSFYWLRNRGKILRGTLFLAAAFIMWGIMPDKWHHRMEGMFDENATILEDKSVTGRLAAWDLAMAVAKDRVVGGGFRTFSKPVYMHYTPKAQHFQDSHSIYFEIIGEQGYIGIVLFALLFLNSFRLGMKTIRMVRGRPDLKWADSLSAYLQLSLVGYGTSGAFLGLAYFDLPYHYLTMLVMTNVVISKALSEEPADSREEVLGRDQPGASSTRRHPGLRRYTWPARLDRTLESRPGRVPLSSGVAAGTRQ